MEGAGFAYVQLANAESATHALTICNAAEKAAGENGSDDGDDAWLLIGRMPKVSAFDAEALMRRQMRRRPKRKKKQPSYVKYVILRKKLQGNPKDAPRAPRGSRRTLSCYHAIIYSYSRTFILSYSHTPILLYSDTLIPSSSATLIHSYSHTFISSYSRTLLPSYSLILTR